MTALGESRIRELVGILERLDVDRFEEWGRILAKRMAAGGRLLLAGNGGSAAAAQHLAAELVGRFRDERMALPALALNADSAALTAIANDYGFGEVYARQVRAHGRADDVLLLISTSGSSPNVVRAAEAGRQIGMATWALTGPDPSPLAGACEDMICVDAPTVATVQECHLVGIHVLCAALDADLAGRLVGEVSAVPSGEVPQPGSAAAFGGIGRHLVVVGDVLMDRDVMGTADRLSPEDPVPVVESGSIDERPGGAGLAAVMATRVPGWRVTLVGGVGRDTAGERVRHLLEAAGVDLVDLGRAGGTAVKTRVRVAGRTLLRVDEDGESVSLGGDVERAVVALAEADVVLVCDYGRGVTHHEQVRAALREAARRVPVVWDPHPAGGPPVEGVALAVPNAGEARVLADGSAWDDLDSLAGDVRRARALLAAWPVRQVAVTRGRAGAVLVQNDTGHPLVVPALAAQGDVCGAGDQFAVAAAVALADGKLPSQAVAAAVHAATAYVAGGGPSGLKRPTPAGSGPADAVEVVAAVRARGGRVVGAGGCFDLLHTGHVALLEQAARLGDHLVVCMNSDASVGRLKGPDRPVVPAAERKAMLLALACVDAVMVFEEDTPDRVLGLLRPDVWVKGGDYAGGRIAESDLVESWGGQVVVVDYLEGRSTTALIGRARTATAG